VLLGVFATKAWNPAGADGLLAGNPSFFIAEVGAVILASVWAFVFTYAMLWLIDRVATVRVTSETEESGLDAGLHGEEAYGSL
jgi:Amt family ammonium transporter